MLRPSSAGSAIEFVKVYPGTFLRSLIASCQNFAAASTNQASALATGAECFQRDWGNGETAFCSQCQGNDANARGNGGGTMLLRPGIDTEPLKRADLHCTSSTGVTRARLGFQAAGLGSLASGVWQQQAKSMHSGALSSKKAEESQEEKENSSMIRHGSKASSSNSAKGSSHSSQGASQNESASESKPTKGSGVRRTPKEGAPPARNFAREQMCTVSIVAKAFESEMVEYFQDSVLTEWVDDEDPVEALGDGASERVRMLPDGSTHSDGVSA